MKAVFISGWATTDRIWDRVNVSGVEKVPISWTKIMHGDFTLSENCIVTGWSLGGQLAMDLSRRAEVRGLVLLSSMTCIASGGNRPGIEPERCSMISRMLNRSRRGYLRSFFMECGANEAQVLELLEQSDEFSMAELISGLSVMFNHVAVPDPSVQVTLIHGAEDRIVPADASRYLCDSVMPGSRSIFINGADHLLPLLNADVIGKAVSDLAENLIT